MLSWSVMASMVGCTITLYLFVRFVLLVKLGLFLTITLLFILLLIGCVQPLSSYAFENVFGKFYPLYRYGIYFLFIGCVILAILTMFVDISWLIANKTGLIGIAPMAKEYLPKVNLFLIASALILTVYALYEGTKVPDIKEINITSDKVAENKKIVLLTDIHIHRVINPEKVKKTIEKVNSLDPDIILLAGDIVDDSKDKISDITNLLKKLKAKQGIYFVSGNHEFYAGYRDSLVTLQRLGFKSLENSGIALKDIYIAGIPDWRTAQRIGLIISLDAALKNSTPQQFKILLSHTPVNFGKENNVDLIVSGHTHGGQIFPFHVLSWLQNQYLSGMYNLENDTKLYVSRGAGQWGPQMRLFAPSEITLINLTKTKGE